MNAMSTQKAAAIAVWLACAATCVGLYSASAGAAPSFPVLDRPAAITVHGERMAMLAIARAGQRLVAAGEFGVVLLSDDEGASWRQAKVPVSVSLTALQFVDARKGWATGHMGVVLHTEDGGETWVKQLDGVGIAQRVLQQAQARKTAGDAEADKALSAAQQLVSDGPDKPLLNLLFSDAEHGFVFGAYNLILRTEDGGRSWTPWQDRVANPKAYHLYGMARSGEALVLAGEQGLLLRSVDGGQHFIPLSSPYKGSYFGIVAGVQGELVAYGLRGNVFVSGDHGETWTKAESGIPTAISSGSVLSDGRLVLASQGGDVLLSSDAGKSFRPLAGTSPLPLAALAQTQGGALVAASLRGVRRLDVAIGAEPR